MGTKKSISTKFLATTIVAVVTLAAGLVFVMTYFMNSLADTILMNMLQPLAKTGARSVEANLHILSDRFFLIGDDDTLTSPNATKEEQKAYLTGMKSKIEFVWIGVYEPDGALIAGSEDCPDNVAERSVHTMLTETENLVIEDTSVNADSGALEIVMGIPVGSKAASAPHARRHLIGGYRYDVLGDVLRNVNVAANGTAFIIAQDGRLMAHENAHKVLNNEYITSDLASEANAENLLRMMGQNRTGAIHMNIDSNEVFVGYAPIRGTRWSLGIQAARSDFVFAVRQAILIGVVLTVIALSVFATAFIMVIRKILTAPMYAITVSAQNLAMGQFGRRLTKAFTERNDEIGRLGAAFASMSDSIHAVIEDIGRLTGSARAGALNERANPAAHRGDYNLIISGINATLDVICSHLDAMPDALALLNEAREPIYLNNAMRSILARHDISDDGERLLCVFLSSGGDKTPDPRAMRLFGPEGKGGDTYDANLAMQAGNGAECNYALTLRKSETTDSVCVMMILHDVTLLTKAKLGAETANKTKSEFLSRMSHEMRTPMNAVIGMTAIGKASDDAVCKDDCFDKIDEASKHLLGVINDILDMSKLEANKFELSYTAFDFEKMLRHAVDVLFFHIEEKEQELIVEIDKDIPQTVVSDERRLSQTVTNLLSNAVKFTPKRGSIALTAVKVSEENDLCTLRISVKDTGIGISEEQQRRLFASFEQADSGSSRKFGGTGLGLAISKRIVHMLGGRIWVESEAGKGSEFVFELSVRDATNGGTF